MSGRRSSYRDDEIPTLYVRQVHYSARPDDLRALFERMGPVRDVYIPLDYYTRESRGFAYVKFEFTRDAEDALRELNGASILGRRIEVEWAEGQRKTKTEMRARDSYGSYRVRSRYRSRSPYKSGRDRSPRRRSPSRHRSSSRSRSRSRSHSHSRSRRRSHNSRRHRSSSRHHQGSARSRNSRSTRSSSVSVKKNREKDRQMKRSKSPHVPGSLHSSLDESNPSDEEHDIVNVQHISNRKSTEDLKESVIDELEMRSEARASDIEIDEKQIQKAAQKNESTNFLDDHVGMEIEGSSTSTTEEEEGDKGAADIEVIDEIVEQNSIVFNGAAVEDACPVDSINVQELLITDTAG
uniref:RRM domain-containing protein n=1 Tax=Setaria digitata TaxID=48799 RepID=A0A915PVW7_9BILA